MRFQFSLSGLLLLMTWVGLTICTLITTDFVLGRLLAGAIFVAAHGLAIVIAAVSPRLRKAAFVFAAVASGHLLVTYYGREIYPLLDASVKLIRWLELPNTPRGLGDYATKGVLALTMLLGLSAAWITSTFVPIREERGNEP
jgi:hypothetical protein